MFIRLITITNLFPLEVIQRYDAKIANFVYYGKTRFSGFSQSARGGAEFTCMQIWYKFLRFSEKSLVGSCVNDKSVRLKNNSFK